MATNAETDQTPAKASKLPLLIGLVLALAGGGGGFYATYSGLLDSLLGGSDSAATDGPAAAHGAPAAEGHGASAPSEGGDGAVGSTAFVPVDPITVNLGTRGDARHLRFSAQLEVGPGAAVEVQRLMPRIVDVLNIYLRALDPHELEEPAALMRLRAQMLRRVQIVTGPGLVNDLLVIEFVFN
ncbi:flagellar basal body-associated FliL family protein [Pararhodobacter zhoushanensis]|uniref:Flagellar protein FliL n=1 Tax=Pararhodobacter zhoushanensis TaxID=2479545 RepID=A0ABT3GXV3_9RHOB|nr:flagellar basal body-associated FliL family protein [Pararhodobacter zhoushanensis]MCW1932394.1 flagellar basal body-associated FliL family protein [Pararhodobacter zhoushanensis]